MNSGVYKITNITNNKCYIGSAKDIFDRWSGHRTMLAKKYHHSRYLQNAYNKYGEKNFTFEILFTCPEKDLLRIEQYCINNYFSEYNMTKIAGSNLGYKHTEETKKKMSEAALGKMVSLETRKKIGVWSKVRIKSDKEKLKLSISAKKQDRTPYFKSVYKICPKTLEILEEFESIKEASIKCSILASLICTALKGTNKTAGKFIWKYKN